MRSIRSVFGFLVCACLLIGARSVHAQFLAPKAQGEALSSNALIRDEQFFHGSSAALKQTIPGLDKDEPAKTPSHKSPYLAAGLSLILPGLGEYYVGDQIWRGVIFTVIDAGLWYGNIRFNSRGGDSLTAFHAWADSLWSPKKYADSLSAIFASIHSDYHIADPNNFGDINMAEDTLDLLSSSVAIPIPLSHRLPPSGSQQYYELISKYIQFTYGWKDKLDGDLKTSSFDSQRHAEMRANMNYEYDKAQYFLYGLFINRILSAIDAALLARDHNSAIHLHGELQTKFLPDGSLGFMPTANIAIRF